MSALSIIAAVTLSAVAMTLIVGVRYLVTSAGFALATRFKHPGLYTGLDPQIRREIWWSLVSAAIYGVPAGVLAWGWERHGWTRVYRDVHDFPLWYLPVSVFAYLFLHDTWFYWTHRWMHRPALFKAVHAVHHASKPPTAWAAMSFSPWEALSGAIFIPALVFVVPIHIAALAVVLTIATVMGVTNHMGWEMFPARWVNGWFGRHIITASHHEAHHRLYNGNYGLYFRFWDRVCGTDRGLAHFAH